MATLTAVGLVWGQVGDPSPEQKGKPFLQPYDPAKDYQNLDSSSKPSNITTEKYKDIRKTRDKVKSGATQKSPKASHRPHSESEIKPANPKTGTPGSLSFQGYNQQYNPGSKSFLDGYLLNSLKEGSIAKENKIVRKKIPDDNSSKNQSKKKKRSVTK